MSIANNILLLFDTPKYFGTLPENNDIFIGYVLGALPSNFVKIFLKIDDNNIIREAVYLANGCPYLIACLETLIELVKLKPTSGLNHITYKELSKILSLPDFKLHCAIQVEEALKLALTQKES